MRTPASAAHANMQSRRTPLGRTCCLRATGQLPAGLLDAWVGIVRVAHAEKPLMARDAKTLEGAPSAQERREHANKCLDAIRQSAVPDEDFPIGCANAICTEDICPCRAHAHLP